HTDSISLVRDTKKATIGKVIAAEKCDRHGIVSVLQDDGEFRATECDYAMEGGTLRLNERTMELLNAKAEMPGGVTPLARIDDGAVEAKPVKAKKGAGKAGRKRVTA